MTRIVWFTSKVNNDLEIIKHACPLIHEFSLNTNLLTSSFWHEKVLKMSLWDTQIATFLIRSFCFFKVKQELMTLIKQFECSLFWLWRPIPPIFPVALDTLIWQQPFKNDSLLLSLYKALNLVFIDKNCPFTFIYLLFWILLLYFGIYL